MKQVSEVAPLADRLNNQRTRRAPPSFRKLSKVHKALDHVFKALYTSRLLMFAYTFEPNERNKTMVLITNLWHVVDGCYRLQVTGSRFVTPFALVHLPKCYDTFATPVYSFVSVFQAHL